VTGSVSTWISNRSQVFGLPTQTQQSPNSVRVDVRADAPDGPPGRRYRCTARCGGRTTPTFVSPVTEYLLCREGSAPQALFDRSNPAKPPDPATDDDGAEIARCPRICDASARSTQWESSTKVPIRLRYDVRIGGLKPTSRPTAERLLGTCLAEVNHGGNPIALPDGRTY
jgi:hypothetical protein